MIDLKLMDAIEAASGPIKKIALLKQQPDSAKELLRIVVEPTVKFYITTTFTHLLEVWERGIDQGPRQEENAWWVQVMTMLTSFADRRCTGSNAELLLALTAKAAPTYHHTMWLSRFVNKDLRCGVSVSTLNKVWPGLIDDLTVMLAKEYDPEKHELLGPWGVEPKLDGYRMTIIDGVPMSRGKKVFTSVDHILKQFSDNELADFVWDGEIMGASKDFDEAGGSIRRKSVQAEGANYHAFDCIPRTDWTLPTQSLQVRRDLLDFTIGSRKRNNIRTTPIEVIDTPTSEQLFAAMRRMIALGYEGAMAKNMRAPYVYDRTDDLLKLKDFTSSDVKIIGCYPGKKGKKHAHHLGGFHVQHDGDVVTDVGGGFTDAQRDEYWERREELNGLTVEVQHQLPNSKNGRFRFPVFIKFRPDKD